MNEVWIDGKKVNEKQALFNISHRYATIWNVIIVLKKLNEQLSTLHDSDSPSVNQPLG
jgi:hypothetical protein